ncbi:MAG TPA: molybdenum cofactor biosynthesis protein MoaE [Gemmatimonadaceae bacterium]|jgi:molybdopterin synthase catalytic subunit
MSQTVAIVHDLIDVDAIRRTVESAAQGATVLFVGTVRDLNDGRAVTGMDYTAYDAMAEKEMGAIAREATDKNPGTVIHMVHRLGYLEVGEPSVVIATSHPHRDAAYAANRYAIEQLKKRVPIWKREHYVDGTREWVDPSGAKGQPQETR